MAKALYLKWRPQVFGDVIGQEHITRTLQNALRQERVRHAYLFSGPRGTGKTTNARLLAKAVNCLHEDASQRPCNECHHCQMVIEGRFLDLIEIDAASHTGVDDVRDLREKIAFTPSEGQYKVYIIDEVHRFSPAAFDALLKTLEEPPNHAIFVLATTEIDKVPATIKSRCLLFEFRRVPVRTVMERLQMICDDDGISIDPAALELIARQGTGSVRDSISLLDQVVADPEEHISLELAQRMLGSTGNQAVHEVVQAIFENDTALGLDILNEAIDMGADPRQFGQHIVDFLRNILLVKIGGVEVVDASDEMRALLEEHAQVTDKSVLMKTIRTFNAALKDIKGGWQPQLPLELALVESAQPLEEIEAPPPPPKRHEKTRARTQDELPPPTDKPAPDIPTGDSPVSLSDVQAGWSTLLNMPALQRTSVPALLEQAAPVRVEGSTLILGVEKELFRKKLQDNIDVLLEAVQETFDFKLGIRFEIGTGQDGGGGAGKYDDELLDFGAELGAEITQLED